MSESNKWHSKWWFTVILGPILVTLVADAVKDVPILTTLKAVGKAVWNFTVAFLNYPLKTWWVLLVLVIGYVVITITKMLLTPEFFKPDYTNYKSETFKWVWKWEWCYDSYYKEWRVTDLKPYCPKCDIGLLDRGLNKFDSAKCPKCDARYSIMNGNADSMEVVVAIINDNIKKKARLAAN